jgi:hypothetical protein
MCRRINEPDELSGYLAAGMEEEAEREERDHSRRTCGTHHHTAGSQTENSVSE